MKRYWLFAGGTHYPSGGLKDFMGSFDSSEDALSRLAFLDYCEWAHIFDSQNQQVVAWRDEEHAWRTGNWSLAEWNHEVLTVA